MARLLELQLLVGVVVVALLSPSLATVYTVGGPAGWTTPSRAKVNYTDWASSTLFEVGDSLEFNYVYKAHTVLEVIRSDFRYCNKSNPLASFDDMNGKTIVELTKPGNYYFIDGVGSHCEEGQKFQAKVTGEALPDILAPAAEPSASPAIPPAVAGAPALASFPVYALMVFLFIATLSLHQDVL
ncbi:hypothetical protein GOP47_0029361 [Adiantum capillus-veneris]|nr:hypothetical protein GOP47_0029361 [Adiantum capillus-veneris]